MKVAPWPLRFYVIAYGVVKCIGIKSLIDYYVVLKKGFQVRSTEFAKQKCVDLRAKFLESEIGGGKECAPGMCGGFHLFEDTSLFKAKRESAKLGGKEVNDIHSLRRGQDNAVDTVDDAIGSELGEIDQSR